MFILSSVTGIPKDPIQDALGELGYSVVQCDAGSREKEFTDGINYALSVERSNPEKDVIFWINPETIFGLRARFPLFSDPIVGLRTTHKKVCVEETYETTAWAFDADDLCEAERKGYCKNLNIEDCKNDPKLIAKAIDNFFKTGAFNNAVDN